MRAVPASAKPVKARRLWWHVHQWAGLKLAIFSAFVFATGTLAVVSAEIDWLLHPGLRVSPVAATDFAAIARGAAAAPGVAAIRYIEPRTASGFAARVAVDYADGTMGYLQIHPVTGAVQGRQGFIDARRVLRNLHRHLNLPTWIGVPVVASLSILILVSFATSLVIYKKWWRGFFRAVRMRDARTMWGDIHRLAGVWSLWFVLLIGLTGLWYLVEALGGEAPPPPRAKVAAIESPLTAIAARLPASLAAARAAAPDLVVQGVRFPDEKSGAFVIEGQRSAWLVRPRANAVWTEAATAKVRVSGDARDLGLHTRISEMADPLHFGTFGGYWTKLPWFLFGAALTALSLSGVVIYGLRIAREARVAASGAFWHLAWRGMGLWRWLSLAAVGTGMVMIARLFAAGGGD